MFHKRETNYLFDVNDTNLNYSDLYFNETFYEETDESRLQRIKDLIFPKSWTWVLIFFHTLVFIIGLIGNILVCLAVYRNHTMRTVTNYFIVNLAVADFLVILLCLPPTVIWDVTLTWFFGDIMCKTVYYLQTFRELNKCFDAGFGKHISERLSKSGGIGTAGISTGPAEEADVCEVNVAGEAVKIVSKDAVTIKVSGEIVGREDDGGGAGGEGFDDYGSDGNEGGNYWRRRIMTEEAVVMGAVRRHFLAVGLIALIPIASLFGRWSQGLYYGEQ
ncbi:hypothetical protein FQA39_LY12066 [Lamprigera yunnana]|nr:hypothetical protein FQA39_LY12066 [Lamprigera yunnana]